MRTLTPEQIGAIARAYCDNRYEQDGCVRHLAEHRETAAILAAWYFAFESVLGKGETT
jgi:hypothetical protein